MKLISAIVVSLTFLTFTYSQKNVNDVKVYNMWSSYDQYKGVWNPWKANDEVFILNYKDDVNKIARFRLNKKIIIHEIDVDTPVKRGTTPEGYVYATFKAYEGFLPYEFTFFENNPHYGMELIVGAVRLRFAKK